MAMLPPISVNPMRPIQGLQPAPAVMRPGPMPPQARPPMLQPPQAAPTMPQQPQQDWAGPKRMPPAGRI